MNQLSYFVILKKRYFNPKYSRERIVSKFWKFFDIPNSNPYNKYKFRLDKLAIKADFCLALHKFLHSDVEFEYFPQVFGRELRIDYDDIQNIKHHLKRIVGLTTLRRNFPEDHNVSFTKLIFDLDYMSNRKRPQKTLGRPDAINEQTLNLVKRELEESLSHTKVPMFSTWMSYNVHGQSLRSIANEQNVTHEAVRLRLVKADKVVQKHLFVKKWYLTDEI